MAKYRTLNRRLARLRGQPKRITVKLDSPEAIDSLARYIDSFVRAYPDLDYEAIERDAIPLDPLDLEGITIASGAVSWKDLIRGLIEITYSYKGREYSDFNELLREK